MHTLLTHKSACLVMLCLTLAACNPSPGNSPQAQASSAAHDHAHAHTQELAHEQPAHDHMPKTAALHQFSADSELALKRPPLYAGQSAQLLFSVTDQASSAPLNQGQATLRLTALTTDNGQDSQQRTGHTAAHGTAHGAAQHQEHSTHHASQLDTAPAVQQLTLDLAQAARQVDADGQMSLNFSAPPAGEYHMSLSVRHGSGHAAHDDVFELGTVAVFTDATAAANAHQHHDHGASSPEGIRFSKPQQWRSRLATTPAELGSIRPSVTATASLRARPDAEALISAPVAGLLKPARGFPRVGQVLKAGEIIAWLIPRQGSDADQASLQAAAGKAQANLQQAHREHQRLQELYKLEAVAQKRLQDAETAEQLAKQDWQAAQARLRGLDGSSNTAGIALRAPISGTLTQVSSQAGAFVNEGEALFHIADSRRLWLEARVAEHDVLRLGQPVAASFTPSGASQSIALEFGRNATLVSVGTQLDATTRTLPVIIEFEPPPGLPLGLAAQARLYTASDTRLVRIPASSVLDESGSQVVYVQLASDIFQRRLVEVGARDGDWVAILSGLTPGERVVSRAAHLIYLSTRMASALGHSH